MVLVHHFIKNKWGACDITRTSLWKKTGNQDMPYINVGIHGFFTNIDNFAKRRRVMISPVEYDPRKIDYYCLFLQQVYIQICQFAIFKENEKIYALHDYTLQSPMIWEE
jgi:hypothetical protein